MESAVYKPYKRKPTEWGIIPDAEREENGRKVKCVEVGKKLIPNEEDPENPEEEYLYEDIYDNIINGIFITKQSYEVHMTISCEPKMVITYDGELVLHNDKIGGYVDQILKVVSCLKKDIAIKAMIDFTLNREANEKFSQNLKKITEAINKNIGSNFPTELCGYVLKQYICENQRQMTKEQEELHYYSSYEDLLDMSGNVLAGRYSGNRDEKKENDLKEEIFYRFLNGNLIERK